MEYVNIRNELEDYFQDGRQQLNPSAFREAYGKDPPSRNEMSRDAEITLLNEEFATALAMAARPYHEVLPLDWDKQLGVRLRSQVDTGKCAFVPAVMPALPLALEAVARDRARLAGTNALIAVRRY